MQHPHICACVTFIYIFLLNGTENVSDLFVIELYGGGGYCLSPTSTNIIYSSIM